MRTKSDNPSKYHGICIDDIRKSLKVGELRQSFLYTDIHNAIV